ncbi:hypothetical protein SNOG_13806 [Parastagonospora nodorum SN15]|uniref:Uncharacterized protein n=1 Tax=Phaeosphaeria nodorum (strain SN15 / ATCC MYA-4574 / FGSC 10173) TaxID=321614 RepID=Q0U358_PHANO|nr:hypothetical protein SNOG_13806 [Parastagonospora nodorum SN15]EAT78830.1 hypothetical protein SNOG_13806 [Parastagonospora nodorum SN15]
MRDSMLDGSIHWKEYSLTVSRKYGMHYYSGTFGFERASLCWVRIGRAGIGRGRRVVTKTPTIEA